MPSFRFWRTPGTPDGKQGPEHREVASPETAHWEPLSTGARRSALKRLRFTFFGRRKHFPDECRCSLINPSIHLVESLLSDGRIPVVALCDGTLSVFEAENTPYVAISHVWIDGLGSTTEEGLPACQVSRIASMASFLVPGGAFWIDGLCVPEQRDLRKRAIKLMAKTYADADAVLVIDAGIRSCSKDAPLEEKLLRIFISGWMQRLWTYQEAMLAKRLSFEFADGLVDLESLIPSDEALNASPLLANLVFMLWHINIYASGDRSATEGLTFGRVANAVRWRMTSRAEDETLAIAGLLHVDVHELLNAPSPDERMRSLLVQKGRVDSDVVFSTAPKILGILGFSWAPRSLMAGAHPGRCMGAESAACTPTGLVADYASLLFPKPIEFDEEAEYVIHDAAQNACSYLLRPIVLVRDRRRELCDVTLMRGELPCAPGSDTDSVGVLRTTHMEGETSGELEHVCHYRDIHFNMYTIEHSEASRRQDSGTQVLYAKSCSRSMFKVL